MGKASPSARTVTNTRMHPHHWPWQGATARRLLQPAIGASVALAMGCLLLVAARHDHPRSSIGAPQCGTDPQDMLRVGEMLEASTLRFVVAAHCGEARYRPDGRIELRYGGTPFDVETRTLDVGGATYVEIVSIGGPTHP
jgi:hypothetical protein